MAAFGGVLLIYFKYTIIYISITVYFKYDFYYNLQPPYTILYWKILFEKF